MAAIVIPFENNGLKPKRIEPTQIVLGKLRDVKLLEKICFDCDIDTKYCHLAVAYVYQIKKYIRQHMKYDYTVELDDVVIHYDKQIL